MYSLKHCIKSKHISYAAWPCSEVCFNHQTFLISKSISWPVMIHLTCLRLLG